MTRRRRRYVTVEQAATKRYQRLYAEARRVGYRPDELVAKTADHLFELVGGRAPRSAP